MEEIANKLSDVQVGKYFVLDVDWTNQAIGKSIYDLDIKNGSVIEKFSDYEVVVEHGIKHILSSEQLEAISVISRSDFYKLNFGGVE